MFKHKSLLPVCLLSVVLLVAGCSKDETPKEEVLESGLVVPADVIVRVDDVMVNKAIFDKYLALNFQWYENDFGKESLDLEYKGMPVKDVLKELVVNQLLDQSLKQKYVTENGYTIDEAVFDEKLAEQKKVIAEDEAQKALFDAVGIDDAFIKYAVNVSIVQSAYNEMVKEVILSDKERVTQLFSQYPVEVKAKHILVETEEKAKEVKAKYDAGEPFEELAKAYSTDSANKDKGGDLGYFPRGVWSAEFDEVAFALPVGSVSDPVKTAFGYHIIYVEGIKTIDNLTEEGEDEVLLEGYKDMVLGTVFNEYSEKLLTETKQNNETEIYYDRLNTPEEETDGEGEGDTSGEGK